MLKDDETDKASSPMSLRRARVLGQLKEAAAKAYEQAGDPWSKYNLHEIPAERVIRHLYHPETQTWSTDETIVKIEREPFTHGAMRFCYRMKKRAQPPSHSHNHRFHKFGWKYALNYVAKAYQKDGQVDTSDEAKRAVQNDIMLQYEAQHWAQKFNECMPPRTIHFIRAYAIEFPDRQGQPWFAVERYITGTDSYGAGFTKHNTNAGFVDTDLHRVTPQVFSAHSFYASHGQRLVADIQGVGDLYTDPQVLSCDYRFGDGDLGPRGMALFFKNFRHCETSDALGIMTFPLSKNELKSQAKYDEDEETLSSEEVSLEQLHAMDSFQLLDANRLRRGSVLQTPKDLLLPDERRATLKRSNVASRDAIRKSMRASFLVPKPSVRHLHRSSSDVDEVKLCLDRAKRDCSFTHRNFHRKHSGELKERSYKSGEREKNNFRKSTVVRAVSSPMMPTEETKKNLGKVHYQLAILHGLGRFPEVVPQKPNENPEDHPDHDAFSVLFHLSHAASLHNAPACLAMARVHAGLDSTVSDLLKLIIPIDFEAAKELLHRAMASPYPPAAPKAAAGCLLNQILHEEVNALESQRADNTNNEDDMEDSDEMMDQVIAASAPSDELMIQVLEETLDLLDQSKEEAVEARKHQEKETTSTLGFQNGDRVEADYCQEGTYYSATVTDVSDDGEQVTVCYDDDGSTERLPRQGHIRLLVPPTATQTTLGGPLSDDEAFCSEEGDDKYLTPVYELQAELAALKEQMGARAEASALFEEAADGAMIDGKMKAATEWSLKAGELQE